MQNHQPWPSITPGRGPFWSGNDGSDYRLSFTLTQVLRRCSAMASPRRGPSRSLSAAAIRSCSATAPDHASGLALPVNLMRFSRAWMLAWKSLSVGLPDSADKRVWNS